jgi:hypothetical protein
MRTVNGFRFTADVVSGTQNVHVTGLFSAPDSLDETVVAGSQTLELLKVGSRTFRRDKPNGAWLAVPATSATSTTDPRSAFGTLAGATSVTVEGSTYQFSLSNAAAAQLIQGSASVTGSALVAGGRITDLRYQSSSPSITVHLTYSAFNQSPAVTLPPGS